MLDLLSDPLHDALVGAATVAEARYEGPSGHGPSPVDEALSALADRLGWSAPGRGAFGALLRDGTTVLVKPNWVSHHNDAPFGVEPLVTHGAVIRAVVREVLKAPVARVIVGDAPLQVCDFAALQRATDLVTWAAELQRLDPRFGGVHDFRRTKSVYVDGLLESEGDQRALDRFILFDLASDSLLEPVSDDDGAFRVTCYPPELMQRTHHRGRHQYLVAREIIEADTVINLPKLKTHRKAGVTCALKNLVGINGNKEFLPHHRIGGSADGGDCYPGSSAVKRALERTLDVQNSTERRTARRALDLTARVLYRIAHTQGDLLGVDGAWSGNDTIWRTCLDLNRVLLYGRTDGSLADAPQRQVVNVVDAIVAGQGNGPLAPEPLPLGLLIGGRSSAAVDWVCAQLLGYEPARIPISRGAFERFRWPIARFAREDVRLVLAGDEADVRDVRAVARLPEGMSYPVGWIDAVSPSVRARAVAEGGRAPTSEDA